MRELLGKHGRELPFVIAHFRILLRNCTPGHCQRHWTRWNCNGSYVFFSIKTHTKACMLTVCFRSLQVLLKYTHRAFFFNIQGRVQPSHRHLPLGISKAAWDESCDPCTDPVPHSMNSPADSYCLKVSLAYALCWIELFSLHPRAVCLFIMSGGREPGQP